MALFSGLFSGTSVVGVDFGAHTIKAVELKLAKNKPTLVNYGWAARAHNAAAPTGPEQAEQTTEVLGQLFDAMNVRAKNAHVAIPSFNGLVMMVNFPRMDESEVAQAIQFEARKYIPTSLEDVSISWEIVEVPQATGPDATMKVLLTAAPKTDIQYYNGLFQGLPYTVDVLELEVFSLVRALVGRDQGVYVVVDIGDATTSLTLVKNGTVHISRTLDAGGKSVTDALAQTLGISPEQAVAQKEGGANFFVDPSTAGIFKNMDFVISEIQRIVSTQGESGMPVNQVILSGGMAKMTGITDFIAGRVGVPTIVGNPWGRISCPTALREHVTTVLGPSFSVAIGLALNNIENV